MAALIFVVGGAGAGKTTLAKLIAARHRTPVFDMDTLLRPAAEALMTQAGLDPNDRDSDAYKRLCRDLGYRITMDAAFENVALGNDAIVIGPFTKEVGDPNWLDAEFARSGTKAELVEVKVLSVYLSDEAIYKERIARRGGDLDRWKLDHWDRFKLSLARREVAWPLPAGAVLYYDNSLEAPERAADRLESFLFGDRSRDGG